MNALREISISMLAAFIVLAPDSLKAETYNLDFSNNGSLEKVFESGLRPHRQRGFEKDKCEVQNVKIGVVLPSGVNFPAMDFEWAEFFVYQNDLLGSAEFRTESVSIDQARSLMSPFFQLAKKSSQEQLETMLQGIAENPLGFEPNFSIGVNGVPAWRVFFRKSYDKEKPVYFGLRIDWKRTRTERAFRETRIEPPPGYESVSMEPPPLQTEVQPFTATTQPSAFPAQQPPSTAQTASSPTVTKRAPSGFPIVPVAILAVVIVGIVLYLLRRKSR